MKADSNSLRKHWYCPKCGRPRPALYERELCGNKIGIFLCADCRQQFHEDELTEKPVRDWGIG